MPKHIFEKQADPVKFENNPFIGTGAFKLHSFDPQGNWTIWQKRDDWQKSVTGVLFGEPKPKYVVNQNWANSGAKILVQLTHKADYLNLDSDGLKARLAQSKTSRAYQPTFPWVVNNDPWNEDVILSELEKDEYLRIGCKFAGRCPDVMDICKGVSPDDNMLDGVLVKCHKYTRNSEG